MTTTPSPVPTLTDELGPAVPKLPSVHVSSGGKIVMSMAGGETVEFTPEQLHAMFLHASINSEPRKATALEGQATALGSQAEAVQKHAQLMERLVEGQVGYTQAPDESVVLSLLIAQAGADIHGVKALANAQKTLVPFRAKYPLKPPATTE